MVAARHNARAFDAVYDAYGERILRFLARQLHDVPVAFEIHQEVFAIALANRRKFRGTTVAEEESWLFTIARNELSHYRRRARVEKAAMKRLAVIEQPITLDSVDAIEAAISAASISQELREALARLPADQRRAVEMRVVDERDYDDIARELGVSQDVVRARVSRGQRALAEALRGTHAEEAQPE